MMHGTYISESNQEVDFDLDTVSIVCTGSSALQKGWSATLVFVPEHRTFVELRSSQPDFRGFSKDEAQQVTDEYIQSVFKLSPADIDVVRKNGES